MLVLNNNDEKKVKYKLYQIGSDDLKKLQRKEKIKSHDQVIINTFDGKAILHVYSRLFTTLGFKILLIFFGYFVFLYSYINKNFHVYSVTTFKATDDLNEFVIDINPDMSITAFKDINVTYKSFKALLPYAIISSLIFIIAIVALIIVLVNLG